jgi:hypothetical protein
MDNVTRSLVMPAALLDEAEALVPLVNRNTEVRVRGQATVSDVLRMAIHEGLPNLRSRYDKPVPAAAPSYVRWTDPAPVGLEEGDDMPEGLEEK